MQNLQVFNFNSNQVRTVIKDTEPWFVLKDVCEVLGINNSRMAADKLDEDEKDVSQIDTLGGKQTMKVVNESGLYTVILRSDKPEAKTFRKWITSEVLPSIRKHGAYMTQETVEKAVADPDFMIGLLENLRESKKQIAIKDQIIGELKPKADYLDRILKSKSLVTITQIAKDYGMSGQRLNAILHEKEIQYKVGEQWVLYQEHADKGYTFSDTYMIEDVQGNERVCMTTKWTQKGRIMIYNELKKDGILPTIERS